MVSFSAEPAASVKDIESIAQILNSRTNGNDAFYNKALAPAQSLQLDKNKSERVQTVNQQIMLEFTSVLNSFKNASEDKKLDSVNQAVKGIEPQVVNNGGAYVSFVDSVPSAATARTFLMIPKSLKPGLTSATILDILTSYKRSAKQNEQLYEYGSAQDLTSGSFTSVQGSDTSWKGSEAAQPFVLNQNYAIKKCRQLLGWRCVTSLYRADTQLSGADAFKLLFIAAYDLQSNPDQAEFSRDKRSTNQITGSTAAYVIKESANWILLYGVDNQWNSGKLSFQGAIQTEFKKDFERLKERISLDLQIRL